MRTHLCANNLPLKAAAGCDVTWTVDIIPSVVDDDMKFYKLYNIFFNIHSRFLAIVNVCKLSVCWPKVAHKIL